MLQFTIYTRNGKYEWALLKVGREITEVDKKRNATVTTQVNFAIAWGEPMNTKAEVLAEIKLIKQWCLHASVVDNSSG